MTGSLFTVDQILTFLALIREENCLKKITGRVNRNIDIFNKLAEKYTAHFPDFPKTGPQLRTKFKSLKAIYLKEKSKVGRSDNACSTWQFYEAMRETCEHTPSANYVSKKSESLQQEEEMDADKPDEEEPSSQTPRLSVFTQSPGSSSQVSSVISLTPGPGSQCSGPTGQSSSNKEKNIPQLEESAARVRDKELSIIENVHSRVDDAVNCWARMTVLDLMVIKNDMKRRTIMLETSRQILDAIARERRLEEN